MRRVVDGLAGQRETLAPQEVCRRASAVGGFERAALKNGRASAVTAAAGDRVAAV